MKRRFVFCSPLPKSRYQLLPAITENAPDPGKSLTSDVAYSPHSIILQQVENGVAVRMAVLYLLAGQR